MVTESQLVAALAQQIGLSFVDLAEYSVDGSAVASISPAVAKRHAALPIGYEDGRLLVAMADPANVFAVDDIRSITGKEVRPVVATKADLLAAIDRYHRSDGYLDELTTSIDSAEEDENDLGKGLNDVIYRGTDPDILDFSFDDTHIIFRGNKPGTAQVNILRANNSIVRIPDPGVLGQPLVVTVTS